MNNWISVKDRLPPYWYDAIISTIDGIVLTAFLHPERGWIEDNNDEYSIENITHWMPLPEPPKPHNQ